MVFYIKMQSEKTTSQKEITYFKWDQKAVILR